MIKCQLYSGTRDSNRAFIWRNERLIEAQCLYFEWDFGAVHKPNAF